MAGASKSHSSFNPTDTFEASSRDLLTVKIYDPAQGKNIAYYGYWDIEGVCVEGSSAALGIIAVAKSLYGAPGKSIFLEALMDKMRNADLAELADKMQNVGSGRSRFVTQTGIAPPLSEGIHGVARGLIWVTTYLSDRVKVSQFSQDPVVQICTPNITISGFLL